MTGPFTIDAFGMRKKKCLGIVVSSLALLSAGLVSGSAHGFEKQHHLSLGSNLSILKVKPEADSVTNVGFGARAYYTYGLSDSFNLNVEGGFSAFTLSRDGQHLAKQPGQITQASIGVCYTLDIVRIVPYFGLLAGINVLTGGTTENTMFRPSLQIAFGADYAFNRKFGIGFAGRQYFMITDMGTYPSLTELALKFEYSWGY